MTERIYIPLLNEGLDVWRPIDAEKTGPDTYRIPSNLDPAACGEQWQFPPGATVICAPRNAADGVRLTAIRLAGSGRKAV